MSRRLDLTAGLLAGLVAGCAALSALAAIAGEAASETLPPEAPQLVVDDTALSVAIPATIGLAAMVVLVGVGRRSPLRTRAVMLVAIVSAAPWSVVVFVLKGALLGRDISVGR